jgi:NDP-sugar pyrophosphorylase family protein
MAAAKTLVILAAGMGSRYGGLKQIDPMGPNGEAMLDYTVADAVRAGFDRVLFIIRHDFEQAFRELVCSRFEGRVRVDIAYQELDTLPAGRTPPEGRVKPWGTGHALWCAREQLDGPFAVLNADDFYGASSLRALADFLGRRSASNGVPEYAMVGFPLGNTLSEHGAVSRGVCEVDASGVLVSIVEHTGIQATEVGAGLRYDPATQVSMNCWAFTPEFLPQLDAAWRRFLEVSGGELKTEFYLPAAVDGLVRGGEARVRVLPTDSQWFGVTYREDKPRVQEALRRLFA